MYRLTPLPVVIIDNIVRGDNFLNYTILAYEGIYRCSADNGLGIVVNSEVQLLENSNVDVYYRFYYYNYTYVSMRHWSTGAFSSVGKSDCLTFKWPCSHSRADHIF